MINQPKPISATIQADRKLIDDWLRDHTPKRDSVYSREQLDKVKSVCRELGII